MERRLFLRNLVAGLAAGAAVRTFPFRVYSFPSQVKIIPADQPLCWRGFQVGDETKFFGKFFAVHEEWRGSDSTGWYRKRTWNTSKGNFSDGWQITVYKEIPFVRIPNDTSGGKIFKSSFPDKEVVI